MMEIIERLLVLQDCDRRIAQVNAELEHIEPERQVLKAKAASVQTTLEMAKHRARHLESERKELELEVEAKKQDIERYSLQQFQTRKNEEYRALAHEIKECEQAIMKIEDNELELMEQIETIHKQISVTAQTSMETSKTVEKEVAVLAAREESLKKELAELEGRRIDLAAAAEEGARVRYERLFKFKGGNVVVGVHHGVCGGCHMGLSPQLLVHCQAQQEIVTCPSCGRILYYTRDMDLAVTD